MPGLLRSSIAVAGAGAAVALAAAIPGGAAASPDRATAMHHPHHEVGRHMRHPSVKGLVAAHHGRTVTVFAKRAAAGSWRRHDDRIKVRFARSAHARVKLPVGDHIRVAATGRAHGHHFIVMRHNDETVTPAPASLFFGTVKAINGNELTVGQHYRDNGDHESGRDRRHGDDGLGDDRRAVAHDHGHGGGDNSGPGHRITVDDSAAAITVDGSTGTPLAVGGTVAVLGESSHDTIVAAQVFGFTNAPAFLRGDITAISGNNVTVVGDDNDGDDNDRAAADDHGHDDAVTVSLAGVPTFRNGDPDAAASDLAVGDKLVLIGSVDSTTGTFTPTMAFAFNHKDENPCGHNDNGDDHGHDGGRHGDDGNDG